VLSGPQRLPRSKKPPKQLIVFLHGYGSNGENLIDLSDSWAEFLPDAEFLSPNGLESSEISPFGYQWFGLKNLDPFNIRSGLESAAPMVAHTLIRWLDERRLTANDLSLVGFSQGAMLALELMFHIPLIRSVLGYSGAFYPPVAKLIPEPLPKVMLVHGDQDLIVPHGAFLESERQLRAFRIVPKMHTCHGLAHSINGEGIDVGGSFLKEVYNAPK
jgi:phospholipase/carboxylesterase